MTRTLQFPTTTDPTARAVRVPRWLVRTPIGLGRAIRAVTDRLGVPHCRGCAARAAALDARVVLVPGSVRRPLPGARASFMAPRGADEGCWRFQGACTGFGRRQCVSGPSEQSPDAAIIEQCCGGWFQYPWIEVCPGQPATTGCGFCFW